MRNALLACTLIAGTTLAACNKSPPATGAAPNPSEAADSAAAAAPKAPPIGDSIQSVPSAAVPDSAAAAAAVPGAPTGNLSDMIGPQLKLTNEQAKAGLGTVLAYAQTKLPAADFEKVSAAVPGAADNIKAAEAAGAVSGPIADQSALTAALGKLGITPDVAAQFVPAATNYISKLGGPEVGKIMQGLTSGM
jgi:hypothetical protein